MLIRSCDRVHKGRRGISAALLVSLAAVFLCSAPGAHALGSTDLSFYASFDKGLDADVAGGRATPADPAAAGQAIIRMLISARESWMGLRILPP